MSTNITHVLVSLQIVLLLKERLMWKSLTTNNMNLPGVASSLFFQVS